MISKGTIFQGIIVFISFVAFNYYYPVPSYSYFKKHGWESLYTGILRWVPSYASRTGASSASGIVAMYYYKNPKCDRAKDIYWFDELLVSEASSLLQLKPSELVNDADGLVVDKRLEELMAKNAGCLHHLGEYYMSLAKRSLNNGESFNDFVRKNGGSRSDIVNYLVESKSSASDWQDTIFMNRHRPWRAYRQERCVPFGSGYARHQNYYNSHTIYVCKDSYVKMIVFKNGSACKSYLKALRDQQRKLDENADDAEGAGTSLDEDISTLDYEDDGSILLDHDYSFQAYRRFCI